MRTSFRLILAFTLFVGLTLFPGCAKKPETITTGVNLRAGDVRATIPGVVLPDEGYAQVRSAWLPGYYQEFREDLFRRDVVKWEGRFDCNKFATAYASGAQMRFYRDQFHSWNPAQALAIGEVWYLSPRGPHAINVALTDRGMLFIEPQTGQEITLSSVEKQSIYYARF